MRALAIAFGFLTRVPVPIGQVEARDLGRAVAWFPAVGAALGAVQLLAQWALAGRVGTGLAALGLVALHAALAALAIALWLHRRLGGLTGDVYGAAIEAAELAFLVAAGLP